MDPGPPPRMGALPRMDRGAKEGTGLGFEGRFSRQFCWCYLWVTNPLGFDVAPLYETGLP